VGRAPSGFAPEGTPVTVRIIGIRQFEGRMAWTDGERIGVELDRALRRRSVDPEELNRSAQKLMQQASI
jgi:hypothetical protein